jgi:mannose-1-phosphate guanylyltransferase
MRSSHHTWAVILAAGEGSRLASLTTNGDGRVVPKQYCSLNGGEPLIEETVRRARAIASMQNIGVIVAAQHRRHWQRMAWDVSGDRLIVQPHNRGTAHGILLSVLSVLALDPLAQIVFLPADHYVRDEAALAVGLRALVAQMTRDPASLAVLGMQPERADSQLGYVLPGANLPDGSLGVAAFCEKPSASVAARLIADGALWNSFIFGGFGLTLLSLLHHRLGDTVELVAHALARDVQQRAGDRALETLYRGLPTIDFSRSVLQGGEAALRVVASRACGWNDLGTPDRVLQTLQELGSMASHRLPSRAAMPARHGHHIDLAAQHARIYSAS